MRTRSKLILVQYLVGGLLFSTLAYADERTTVAANDFRTSLFDPRSQFPFIDAMNRLSSLKSLADGIPSAPPENRAVLLKNLWDQTPGSARETLLAGLPVTTANAIRSHSGPSFPPLEGENLSKFLDKFNETVSAAMTDITPQYQSDVSKRDQKIEKERAEMKSDSEKRKNEQDQARREAIAREERRQAKLEAQQKEREAKEQALRDKQERQAKEAQEKAEAQAEREAQRQHEKELAQKQNAAQKNASKGKGAGGGLGGGSGSGSGSGSGGNSQNQNSGENEYATVGKNFEALGKGIFDQLQNGSQSSKPTIDPSFFSNLFSNNNAPVPNSDNSLGLGAFPTSDNNDIARLLASTANRPSQTNTNPSAPTTSSPTSVGKGSVDLGNKQALQNGSSPPAFNNPFSGNNGTPSQNPNGNGAIAGGAAGPGAAKQDANFDLTPERAAGGGYNPVKGTNYAAGSGFTEEGTTGSSVNGYDGFLIKAPRAEIMNLSKEQTRGIGIMSYVGAFNNFCKDKNLKKQMGVCGAGTASSSNSGSLKVMSAYTDLKM